MKSWFARLNIKHKLGVINIATSGAAFVVAALILLAFFWSYEKDDLLRDAHDLARIMAQNSAAPLVFDDALVAGELLDALNHNDDVIAAELLERNGRRVASYRRAGVHDIAWEDIDLPGSDGRPPARFRPGYLDIVMPVELHGAVVGTYRMRLDRTAGYQRLLIASLILFAALLAAVSVAILVFNRLQRRIVEPLQRLLESMARVSTDGDYTQRVDIPAEDEIGALGKSFNQMIGQIEVRDRALARELHERNWAETQLRHSEARLRLALEGAGAGSYEWHVDSGFSFWSAEIWNLLGLKPDDTAPSFETWRRVVHPDDIERVERSIEAAVARGVEFDVKWRVNLPGGAVRWIVDRARPLRDENGRIVCYIGMVIDISELKRTEESLNRYRNRLEEMVAERTAKLVAAESEQRHLNRALRLLSDCNIALVRSGSEQHLLDDLCRLIVESGDYLMAWVGKANNDAAKSVRPIARSGREDGYLENVRVSWDGEQATGRGPTGTAIRTATTQIVRNCATNPQLAPWHEAIRQRGFETMIALPIIVDGGVEGTLVVYAAEPDAFAGGEVELLEEVANNVAYGLQALRARRELEGHRRDLEALVAARTGEILALNVELTSRASEAEAANRAKSDFLATMSHEIRTPLNAVVGLSALLNDTPLDRRQRDYADKIRWSAETLRTLIDDILDFSKIEAGALHLEQSAFSLNAILRTSAAIVSVGTRGKAIETLFDVDPDVPDALIGDALRLQQILLNLCSNAVKFTEQGVIVVSVRSLAPEPGLVNLEFAVKDSGIGIPAEQLERIFEVFTQADSSTSRQYGGTGLGLSISSRLAALMGGRITVASAPGEGSEFRFSVCLGAADTSPKPVDREALKGISILVVDDHPLARDIISRTGVGLGWQVTAVDSGPAALDELQRSAAEERDYDLMLLDWRMPGMDGLEMLRAARQRPGIGLPMIVLMASAFELEQAAAASDDLFLDGLVAKPLTPEILFEAVRRAYAGDAVDLAPVEAKADRRLAGMRLLVAEDNEINRSLIERILGRAGAEVVLAVNGQAAVDALKVPGAHFDAVLMDLQMPVMDGFTATQVIREEMGRRDLPIIAVTAHALASDRERARNIGMAGLILKPIDIEDLLDLVAAERRHLPPAAIAPPPAQQLDLPGLDPAALDIFGGDQAAYGEFLRQFAAQHDQDVATARALFEAGDGKQAARLVHQLAGVASFLRAEQVAGLAVATERALLAGEALTVTPLFDELQAAMDILTDSISRY
ncbi:MAG: response regulator [Bacteroidota bacterium]